jgi:aminoglycoside phosphotransferase (APT) family kinase protein
VNPQPQHESVPSADAPAGADVVDDQTARAALEEACPNIRVAAIKDATSGYSSRQWLAETDEGRLLVKVPVRNTDPEHFRQMIAATRLASEAGVPAIRFRGFVPHSKVTATPVIVQEFVEGVRASDVWETIGDDGRQRVAGQFGATVATVHLVQGDGFGPVLSSDTRSARWDDHLASFIDAQLQAAPADVIPAGRAALAASLESVIPLVAAVERPSLTHGDLWLENVLLDGGDLFRLLDFEHGQFLDPLYDFGKPDELIFERWPAVRRPFFEGYESVRPLPADAELRIAAYRGFQFLFMFNYFTTWSPQFLDAYRDRLQAWVGEHPAAG